MADKQSNTGIKRSASKDDSDWVKPPPNATQELSHEQKPPLETLISSYDFEKVASKTLSKKTWAFYSSAATDLITRDANKSTFNRIWFRPRILRNVRNVNTKTKMLGRDMSMPLFQSPTALAGLVHPEGEKAMAAACFKKGIPQCIATNASIPMAEIMASAPTSHSFFFQIYVNPDRAKSAELIEQAKAAGAKAIWVTVDAPVPGKREADERVKADENISAPMSGEVAQNDAKGGGLGRIMGRFVDPSLNWDDIAWLKEVSGLPVVLKGIQGAADAKMAMQHGVSAIVLSNHGGRSLDTSPPAILMLLELQKCCPEVFDHLEVYIDGGIRRGTDILKCLCLGATAVGMGRHFLYALNYGREGVESLVEIMKDELETSMRMIGLTDISQCHPGLVNTLEVDHLVPSTSDHPYAKWRRRAKL